MEGQLMLRALVLSIWLLPSFSAEAADCSLELRPEDTYRDLSFKLKCLSERLAELEKLTSAYGNHKSESNFPKTTELPPGKCFSYPREQPFNVSIVIAAGEKPRTLCWSDGTVFGKILTIEENGIEFRSPRGTLIANVGWNRCNFNEECSVNIAKNRISFIAEKLIGADNKDMARINIASEPNP